MWTMVLLSMVWLADPALVDATGRILAEDGKPVKGAQVCEFTQGAAERCVTADDQGGYRITRTTHPTLLVRSKGFVPMTIDAAPLSQPVKLHRAASLLVTIVDAASGKPLNDGRVMIDTPSGKRVGNFVPFNKAGVRISTLEPGVVFVRAEANGYDPGGPVPIELESGAESSTTITMKKKSTAAGR